MRESLKDKNRLEHMLERIDFVLDAANGYTYEQFCNDKIRFAAYRMVLWLLAKPLIC